MSELAELAGVSPSHLAHACTRFLGESPLRLLRRLRMDVAAKLLASNPDLSIADVADRLGYRDPSLFARHFRAVTGTSPRGYRRGTTD